MKFFLIMIISASFSAACHSSNKVGSEELYIELIDCRWKLGAGFKSASNDIERPQWNKLSDDNLYQVAFQPEQFDIEFQKSISVVTNVEIASDNGYLLTSYKASIGDEGSQTQYFVVSHDLGTLIFGGFSETEFHSVVGDCFNPAF